MERILRECGVLTGEWYQSKMIKQIVPNPVKLIRYFKFRGRPDVFEYANSMSPLEESADFHRIDQITKTQSGIDTREYNRQNKLQVLKAEIIRRGVYAFDQIHRHFNADEILDLNVSIGLHWMKIAEQAFSNLNTYELIM
ncbi:unnamed protein product [Hymenolepis diminuta]|uniref:Uncharacterized protein n=1 Tax=Hymenolepis diminuta TaxID=6216 RepID=A0A564YXN5_HYMDI|nr:unnamed protein product [Hymenolepis diminuta]